MRVRCGWARRDFVTIYRTASRELREYLQPGGGDKAVIWREEREQYR
jgi:hypothetical protein